MPPTILRRSEGDVTRRYWWLILVALVLVGAVALVMIPKGGGPGSGGGGGSADLATEQGLESIDDGLKAIGAPGGPINLSMEGTGAYKRGDDAGTGQKSSLYEAPSTAHNTGAPVAAAEAVSSAAGSGSLAEALKKVASSKPDRGKNKGWGGAAVRTGFTPPKAKFGGLSGPGGSAGGGGGSGASLGVGGVARPFGLGGGDPGSAPTVGLGGDGGVGGAFKIRKGGHNQAFDHLKKVETVAGKAAVSGGDLAANLGSRSFDAASARAGFAAGTPTGGGAVIGSGDAVPENLKLDDPRLQNKKIEVPAVGADKSANPKMDMENQIVMMLMMAAIGGIAGPMFGAIGVGMANMVFGQNMRATYNIAPPPPPGVSR